MTSKTKYKTLLKHDDISLVKLYKNIFTLGECSELTGLLLYKSGINWIELTNNLGQTRSITAFSTGRRSKYIKSDPHPISKHMDIFSIINPTLTDLFREMDESGDIRDRNIDQWTCYLYMDGDDYSPEISMDIQTPDTPIVIIVLGCDRNVYIKSKKTDEIIVNKVIEEGSVLFIFEPFDKYYTYQVPMVECCSLHIQMFGNFIKY